MSSGNKSLNEILSLFEQSVLLLSQELNSSSHHRRENILSTLIDSYVRVKDILKEQSENLDTPSNECLFGENFESRLIRESTAKQKSKSVFTKDLCTGAPTCQISFFYNFLYLYIHLNRFHDSNRKIFKKHNNKEKIIFSSEPP